MKPSLAALVAVAALAYGPARASVDVYAAVLLGINECAGSPLVCGVGDPDGWGVASVHIDNATNEVDWLISVNNIDPLTAAHIHFAPAGVNGPVRIDFSGALTGSVVDADAAFITPGSFADKYVNVHNAVFPGGAVRGQLMYITTVSPPVPEPSTYALMLAGLGAVAFAARRRRRDPS